MLQIMDRPGCITVSAMKKLFEQSIQSTPVLKANTPLGEVVVNGTFSHYADPNTDTMWIGFAIGMRAAERIQKDALQTLPSAAEKGNS